jgi:hypothetical protein
MTEKEITHAPTHEIETTIGVPEQSTDLTQLGEHRSETVGDHVRQVTPDT